MQVEQQARGDVADRAAGLLEVRGVAEHRLRVAVGDVHDAEQAQREGRPADHLAPGGAVALGVAQRAPPGADEEQRHEPADLADRAGGHRAGEVHHSAGQLPPHGGGRRRWRGRRGTARRRRGGARGRGRGPTARSSGRRRRRRGPGPATRRRSPRPSAPNERETGPGPLRTARGAGRDAGRREDALERLRPFAERSGGRLLVLRDRVLEPLVVRLFPDVLELRDPGGEDVRVAMVRPYGHVTPVTGTTRVRVVTGTRVTPGRAQPVTVVPPALPKGRTSFLW